MRRTQDQQGARRASRLLGAVLVVVTGLAGGSGAVGLVPSLRAATEAEWCSPETTQQAYEQLLAAAPDGGDVEARATRIADEARARGDFDQDRTLFALDDLALDSGYVFGCDQGVYRHDPGAAGSAGMGPACGETLAADEPTDPGTDEPAMGEGSDGTESTDEAPVEDTTGDNGEADPQVTVPAADPCAVDDGSGTGAEPGSVPSPALTAPATAPKGQAAKAAPARIPPPAPQAMAAPLGGSGRDGTAPAGSPPLEPAGVATAVSSPAGPATTAAPEVHPQVASPSMGSLAPVSDRDAAAPPAPGGMAAPDPGTNEEGSDPISSPWAGLGLGAVALVALGTAARWFTAGRN